MTFTMESKLREKSSENTDKHEKQQNNVILFDKKKLKKMYVFTSF